MRGLVARTTPDKLWDGPFLLPVPGPPISSFGKRSILNGQPRSPHAGTDFRAGHRRPGQGAQPRQRRAGRRPVFFGKHGHPGPRDGVVLVLRPPLEDMVEEGDVVERGSGHWAGSVPPAGSPARTCTGPSGWPKPGSIRCRWCPCSPGKPECGAGDTQPPCFPEQASCFCGWPEKAAPRRRHPSLAPQGFDRVD